MQGSSTPTPTDALKEIKQAKLELNAIKSQIEVARRELNEYETASYALGEEIQSKIGVSDLKNAVLENIIKNRLQYNIKEYEKKIEKFQAESEIYTRKNDKVLTDLQENYKTLKDTTDEIINKTEELEKITNAFNLTSGNISSQIKEQMKRLNDFKEKADKEQERFEDFQGEYLEKKAWVMKEQIRLSNKESDLNIYEARLRAKYLELWPEMEIVI